MNHESGAPARAIDVRRIEMYVQIGPAADSIRNGIKDPTGWSNKK